MVSSSSSMTTTGDPPLTAPMGGGRVPRQIKASRMAGKWVVICKKAFKRNMNAFLSIERLINGAIKRVKQTHRTVYKLPTKNEKREPKINWPTIWGTCSGIGRDPNSRPCHIALWQLSNGNGKIHLASRSPNSKISQTDGRTERHTDGWTDRDTDTGHICTEHMTANGCTAKTFGDWWLCLRPVAQLSPDLDFNSIWFDSLETK